MERPNFRSKCGDHLHIVVVRACVWGPVPLFCSIKRSIGINSHIEKGMNIVGFLLRERKRRKIVVHRGQLIGVYCVASASKERIEDGFGESIVGIIVKILSL